MTHYGTRLAVWGSTRIRYLDCKSSRIGSLGCEQVMVAAATLSDDDSGVGLVI